MISLHEFIDVVDKIPGILLHLDKLVFLGRGEKTKPSRKSVVEMETSERKLLLDFRLTIDD